MLKILVYGFPSLPLASLYFSIYVLLGEFYFDNYGLSLSIIGSTFIIIRLIDAFSDPIMGYISDNFISKLGIKYKSYSWGQNYGYGTKQHLRAIKKFGVTIHHRKTFSPVNKLITSK